LVVCISWVFFRAKTLPQALSYLASLVGLVHVTPASDVVSGALYTPYHSALFAVCAFAVWAMPNTWQLTQKLSAPRAAYAAATLALATLVMWTQTTNPFLYFQF
jgi:alginate O-acetyltransferase complex protein AlgI